MSARRPQVRQQSLFERVTGTGPIRRSDRMIEVAVETKNETAMGVWVSACGPDAFIPFSMIEEDQADIEIPSPCQTLTIPEWLAKEKGLI